MQKQKNVVVGLALGGGGALGLAHIGALKVLEENNIKIDKIAGVSMGAIIGAMFAFGYSSKKLKEIARNLTTLNLVELNFSLKGLLSGNKALKLLKKYIPQETSFEDLNLEFCCNALDLYSGQEVVLDKGNLLMALRASFSVPLFFNPLEYEDKLLIDGGVVNNLPDNLVRQMGANYIIGIDIVNTYLKNQKYKSMGKVIYSTVILAQLKISKNKKNLCNVVIKPKVEKYKMHKFSKSSALEIIKLGERAMLEQIEKIKQDLKNLKN